MLAEFSILKPINFLLRNSNWARGHYRFAYKAWTGNGLKIRCGHPCNVTLLICISDRQRELCKWGVKRDRRRLNQTVKPELKWHVATGRWSTLHWTGSQDLEKIFRLLLSSYSSRFLLFSPFRPIEARRSMTSGGGWLGGRGGGGGCRYFKPWQINIKIINDELTIHNEFKYNPV